MSKKIIIPLPSYGFDPTECAIPWKFLSSMQHEITFASPDGIIASADSKMLYGKNLGIWKNTLMARADAVQAYQEMEKSKAFCNPIKYTDINEQEFDAILLPGGHDKGMREYIESNVLQQVVVSFFKHNKPVAAICHGVVLVARSIDAGTKKSVLYNYKTTSLLNSQEKLAFNMTRLWLKDYYLTYPEITVEDEVKSVLKNPGQFIKGKTPLFRDDNEHLSRGFALRDRNYLSARWPGDAYNFSVELLKMLE